MKTIIEIFQSAFEKYSNRTALKWRNGKSFDTMTFKQMGETTQALSLGLIEKLSLEKGSHIAIFADVSHEWTISNIAIQLVGCVDVPRGTDSTNDEMAFIAQHAETKVVFVQDSKQIKRVRQGLEKYDFKVETFIIMQGGLDGEEAFLFDDLISEGKTLAKDKKKLQALKERQESVQAEDLSTIIYTSGTTGEPKGVMLTQANFAFQLNNLPKYTTVHADDRVLTILPPWHIFGRIAEYLALTVGCELSYTDIKNLPEDMKLIKPTFMPAVPRIWEGVYNKVLQTVKKSGKEDLFKFFEEKVRDYYSLERIVEDRDPVFEKETDTFKSIFNKTKSSIGMLALSPLKLFADKVIFSKVKEAVGGKLRISVSGGGALPLHIDAFFTALGISIAEGYGMTETTALLSVRREERLVPGTVGPLVDDTELKLFDLEGNDVTHIPGAKGTLHVRGPQIMRGYYKNPEKTKEVLTEDGWMNTGDIIRITTKGDLVIVGRSKDTVVLLGGENVEPNPIEERLKYSPYIDHAMVVGHDQKSLGVLLVANEDELYEFAKSEGLPLSIEKLTNEAKVKALYKKEIASLINGENGFKSFERIGALRLLVKPFEKADELNNTLKIRRHIVFDKYADLIKSMYV